MYCFQVLKNMYNFSEHSGSQNKFIWLDQIECGSIRLLSGQLRGRNVGRSVAATSQRPRGKTLSEIELCILTASRVACFEQVLSEVDRSSILDDAFNLARATQLDYATALSLTKYLDSEESYVPWRSMGRLELLMIVSVLQLSSILIFVSSRVLSYISLQLYTDSEFASWRNYIRNISTPMMQKLRVEDLPTDSHLDRCSSRCCLFCKFSINFNFSPDSRASESSCHCRVVTATSSV